MAKNLQKKLSKDIEKFWEELQKKRIKFVKSTVFMSFCISTFTSFNVIATFHSCNHWVFWINCVATVLNLLGLFNNLHSLFKIENEMSKFLTQAAKLIVGE